MQPTNSKQSRPVQSGILCIAGGRPQYGRLAFNLALSIKATEIDTPIALVADAVGLSQLVPSERAIFDTIIDLPPALYQDGKTQLWGRLKCSLDKLTPFERTLFIDVDSIWFPGARPSRLFAALQGTALTAQNSDAIPIDAPDGASIECWAKLRDMRPHFELNYPIWRTHSYCVYFEQSTTATLFFETARKIHDTLRNDALLYQAWQNTVPDELCYALATGHTGIGYHQPNYSPLFAFSGPTAPPRYHLFDHYYGGTQPGNRSSAVWRKLYNDLTAYYYRHFRHPVPTRWIDKARF